MYYAAQDIIEYLMASYGGGAQDAEHRALRAAAHHAYRDVLNARDWLWHVSEATVTGSGDFTLPENVKNIDALVPPQNVAMSTVYVSPTEWTRIDTKFPTLNSPIYWTIVRNESTPDRWMLRIAGSPASTTYRYTFRRRPSPLRYMGYESACRQLGFAPEGAVRRYGTATNFPESLFGVHAYTAQEIIGLNGSLVGTPPQNAKTAVSDYLDVSDSMYTALLSGAEVWLARLMGKNIEGSLAIYQRDLRMAYETDGVAPLAGNRTGASVIGTALALGYYSPSGPDTGA